MKNRFGGQVAVITGAADGLGRGIAERIASEGGKVILLDINETLLNNTVKKLKSANLDVEGFK
jgi:NAD(P)-dependent dehydrogenase (short-subunit alcohol dehydrogenase family)